MEALSIAVAAALAFALKNDPNILACLACTASSFALSSSFFLSSASRALVISTIRALLRPTHAFFSAFSAFLASASSFLTRAASSCESALPRSEKHTSSGVIFDFLVGEALLLESLVAAVPSRLALGIETLGDC